ncbi:ADP-ribose pyrophosphatase YjhB (NUDIX family) [Virgibacillus natechei]|uniref:ADP-ribose pyrophosphatase YjhB (NUDIX family) n=1 Tax=Virgibacillus natechei TaxID=1216297 RepID=A0ABS4IHK9_9BACI|nr:NUDIX hydrolase [Virgibacillus natechei]MBP1970442.1 ADP-ribose pyrophosphatase YjhB (NUDIX family) [Virgibacillus natechei]UZD13906.1 NUDIX hydrolase [Virgibacillus natechei]
MSYKWLEWAKRIQSVSQAGLAFSKDVYDRERFEELRSISAEIMEEYTDLEMEKIKELFTNETGYQTPKVDVRGAVFKDNKILLVREKMDDKWALPGGFCDIGFSPTENVIKEIKEESGYDVVYNRLLAVLDTNKHAHPPLPYHYYKLFIHCEIIGGHASNGVETKDVEFFSESNLPILSTGRNTEAQIQMLFDFLRNPGEDTMID